MKTTLLNQIKDYFEDVEEVTAVYLFGSVAARKEKTTSDIDIAILLKSGINPYKPVDLQLRIMSDLDMLFKKRVDVVLLGFADPVLEHQIRKYGKVLIDKIPKVRFAYEVDARRKYFDFIYRHNNYMKALKNRILQAAR
ncbi:MAG: nucleotidyltransferase domain-containing protein [Nitrospirae bacterium]|nr:nucleotidyltransferase domain-containing protein [Nitrospirota bacterium]